MNWLIISLPVEPSYIHAPGSSTGHGARNWGPYLGQDYLRFGKFGSAAKCIRLSFIRLKSYTLSTIFKNDCKYKSGIFKNTSTTGANLKQSAADLPDTKKKRNENLVLESLPKLGDLKAGLIRANAGHVHIYAEGLVPYHATYSYELYTWAQIKLQDARMVAQITRK